MEGQPSASAERVARLRAAHQLIDDPRVFDDPLAVRILGAGAAALVSDEREDRSSLARSLRAFLAVRSRVAEDEVAAAYERGIRQYVVLGAGLDMLWIPRGERHSISCCNTSRRPANPYGCSSSRRKSRLNSWTVDSMPSPIGAPRS